MRIWKPHRGILIDQIPAKGVAGLIFALGTMAILLIGIPEVRLFFAVSLAAGALLGGGLYFWRNQTRW